jgi:hypothetical protein
MTAANIDNISPHQLLCMAVDDPEHFQHTQKLLSWFWHGFPAEHIAALLRHRDRRAVLCGLFIVDEIYERSHPVLELVTGLCCHNDPEIRCAAMYATRSAARAGRESAFAHVLRHLTDEDGVCRQVAMWLAADAPNMVLETAMSPSVEYDEELRYALEQMPAALGNVTLANTLLRGSERVAVRRCAAIAIARAAHEARDLEAFTHIPDPDIRAFLSHRRRYLTDMACLRQRQAEMRARLNMTGRETGTHRT